MPHFVIDCSNTLLKKYSADEIMKAVHDTAEATGLFKQGDIKVRIHSFEHYNVANTKSDFIHVFGNIMEGRTIEQRADLSKRIITKLKAMFPDVTVVSMNVQEFEKATYNNRNTI